MDISEENLLKLHTLIKTEPTFRDTFSNASSLAETMAVLQDYNERHHLALDLENLRQVCAGSQDASSRMTSEQLESINAGALSWDEFLTEFNRPANFILEKLGVDYRF